MTTPLSTTRILPVIQHPLHVHRRCSFSPIFFLATNRTAQLSIPGFVQLVKPRNDRESAPATTPTREAVINPSEPAAGVYCYCVITNITYTLTHITALLSLAHHKSYLKQLVHCINKHKGHSVSTQPILAKVPRCPSPILPKKFLKLLWLV